MKSERTSQLPAVGRFRESKLLQVSKASQLNRVGCDSSVTVRLVVGMKLCASSNSPIQWRNSIGGEFNLFLALNVFHRARTELLRERRLDSFTKVLVDEHGWEFQCFS